MDHDPKDCRTTRNDFEMYATGTPTIFYAAIKNYFKL